MLVIVALSECVGSSASACAAHGALYSFSSDVVAVVVVVLLHGGVSGVADGAGGKNGEVVFALCGECSGGGAWCWAAAGCVACLACGPVTVGVGSPAFA